MTTAHLNFSTTDLASLVVALRYCVAALEINAQAYPMTLANAHNALQAIPFELHLLANDMESLDMEAA